MSVIRIKKHIEKFVVLYKEILEDPEISLKTKGFWAFCMSKPDDWVFYVDQLVGTLKEGKDAIYSCINELIKFGYCRRTLKRKDEQGRWISPEYEIFELKELLPQRDFPEADNPDTENPPLTNNNSTSVIDETVCPMSSVSVSSEIPEKIKKINSKRDCIEFSLQELFKEITQQRFDWTVKEIEEAWKILVLYEGAVNNCLHFCKGTIENLRSKKRIEDLKEIKEQKYKEKEKKPCQPIPQTRKREDLAPPGFLMQLLQTCD